MRTHSSLLIPLTLVLLALVPMGPALAEDDAEARAWENKTELGFVTTTGNSETENFSVKNTFTYSWDATSLRFRASMLRASQTTRTAENVGGELQVSEMTETTAEAYALSGKVRRDLSERTFLYGAAGWERNRFSGIESRYVYGAGAGYQAAETETQKLALEIGLEYTDEESTSGLNDTFAGARAAVEYEWKFSETAQFNQDLELLWNLEESDDYRINSISSVTAALTSKLALKTSYTIQFDNEPVVQILEAPGFDPVVFEFEKTDTILSASLVINF